MKNKILPLITFYIIVSLATKVSAQVYPQNYFRCPLDIPISLAGCFGELRTNHFHTGIDLKTAGEEGLKVYAAADGFVSRIGVSASGYGNALYITHPNGYTTVYGHLSFYNDAIQKYLKQIQYKSENFEQDIAVDPKLFPIKKGDVIALSGNTGGSAGPHLHFEIRESKTEKPINPLLFGLKYTDIRPPVIHAIKIYPLDSNSYIKAIYAGNSKKGISSVKAIIGQNIKIEAYFDHGKYHLKNIAQLQATGKIGFAIEAHDYGDSSNNKIGIYGIELCVNDQEIYFKTMKRLDFDLKRYINTHIDYPEKVKSGRWFEKSYVAPNNILPIYSAIQNNGMVTIKAGSIYHVNYYLHDYNENFAELGFEVMSLVKPEPIELPAKNYDTLLRYQVLNTIRRPSLLLNIPSCTFFENEGFSITEFPVPKKAYSKLYLIGNVAIPCEDYFEINIKTENLPDHLREKACMLSYIGGYLGGDYENGWIKAKARNMGKFFISADTIPPSIVPLNIRNGRKLNSKTIRFVITDKMSGLKSYRGTIDGKWVLFERDSKHSVVYYTIDDHCTTGKHHLVMIATDNKNNLKKVEIDFSL